MIAEAMSCGLPVITYKIGANVEIIDDGVDGFLVNNQNELIEKINLLASSKDLIKKMSINARDKVEKKFNVVRMVEEYEKNF